MKLTGRLKEKVEAAKSRDQAKKVIARAGMLLTDGELEQVAGGGGTPGIEENFSGDGRQDGMPSSDQSGCRTCTTCGMPASFATGVCSICGTPPQKGIPTMYPGF